MKECRGFWRFTTGVLALCLFPALLFPACSGKKVNENDPADLYRAAEEDIGSERYLQALDRLRILQNKFPYSNYSVTAGLRKADVYWAQESYAEAAASYESFCELHPKHEKTPYARFRAAESYDRDTPSNIARDLTSAQKAIQGYERFLSLHGSDPEAPKARERVQDLRKKLAAKELYIAKFYKRWDAPDSSRKRLEDLIRDYPGSEPAKEAKEVLDSLPPVSQEEGSK